MFAATAFLAATLLPQASTATQPPDLTLPPETAHLVTILEGRGAQIYTCTAQGNGYSWTLTAPDAKLFNLATGKQVGQHSAGPTWTLEDGSSIKGTLVQRKAADTPADVPWLLLKTQSANTATGTLSPVTFVRRYNTHGGSAPVTGCDATHPGATIQVPYTATYAFYSTAP